jgi:hypothetical protein
MHNTEYHHDENEIKIGLGHLETPPEGDYISGLRNFVSWVETVVAKQE